MHRVVNTSPFLAALDVLPDAHGADTLLVTLKATFEVLPQLAVAGRQQDILVGDVYRGEPGRSSLRYAGERHLAKPGTDVALLGRAHAPQGRPVTDLDVALTVGPLHKVVRVLGDRRDIAAPAPFTTMPLIHERAVGGDLRNPIGVTGDAWPNLEDPHDPAAPACFAAIPPSWSPRRDFAGTYDDAWRRTRAPYLPADFDPRFFHTVAPDQTTVGHLRGGEPVHVEHASPSPLQFTLPLCAWSLRASFAGRLMRLSPRLESVTIEPDDRRLCMLWRAALALREPVLDLDEVTVDLRRLDLAP